MFSAPYVEQRPRPPPPLQSAPAQWRGALRTSAESLHVGYSHLRQRKQGGRKSSPVNLTQDEAPNTHSF